MRIILCLVAALLIAAPTDTLARSAFSDTVAADYRRMEHTTLSLVSSPFHASTKDWVGAAALAAAVAFTAALDEDTQSDAATWHRPWMNTVDDIGHTFQQTPLFAGTAAAFYVGGYATHRPEVRRVGADLVVAWVVAQAGTQVVKHVVGRSRPYTGDGPGHFVGPVFNDDFLSFWSGDVTNAFTLASVLSAEAERPAVTLALYGLASMTAFQRIHQNRHWLSDVAAAAVWSSAVGITTVKIEKRKLKNEKSPLGVNVYLRPAGLAITW